MKTVESEERDPTADLSLAELCGLVWHKEGPKALKAMLEIDPNDFRAALEAEGLWPPPQTYRGDMMDVADELKQAGMKEAATIVRRYARTLPHQKLSPGMMQLRALEDAKSPGVQIKPMADLRACFEDYERKRMR